MKEKFSIIILLFAFCTNFCATQEIPHFPRRSELSSIDCARLFSNDNGYTDLIQSNRPVINDQLAMDCDSIKQRVLQGLSDKHFEHSNYSIAFARNVYTDYAFIEFQIASNYHPKNHFCLSVDSDASQDFMLQVNKITECIPNVFTASNSYKGRGHLDCLQRLRFDRDWKYVMLLENHDMVLKSNKELEGVFKILNGANDIMMAGHPNLLQTMHSIGEWDLEQLKLFKTHKSRDKMKDVKLHFARGAPQATLSREAVLWLTVYLNSTGLYDQFNWMGTHQADEFLLPSLSATEQLEMPGGFTHFCIDKLGRHNPLTRLNRPLREKCTSKIVHGYNCVFGIEDLPLLAKTHYLSASTMLPSQDFAAISCVSEMIFNKTYVRPPLDPLNKDEIHFYRGLSFVRYQNEKKKPNFDINKFKCEDRSFQ